MRHASSIAAPAHSSTSRCLKSSSIGTRLTWQVQELLRSTTSDKSLRTFIDANRDLGDRINALEGPLHTAGGVRVAARSRHREDGSAVRIGDN